MSQIKNGKKPLDEKTSEFSDDLEFANILGLDPALKRELEEQGLEPVWLNAKEMRSNDGYHQHGWQVYKRKSILSESKFGTNPDGVVVRGDLVLGVMRTERHEKLRNLFQRRADQALGSSVPSEQAKKLRKAAADSGVRTDVSDSYDEK